MPEVVVYMLEGRSLEQKRYRRRRKERCGGA
jgi:hypothetical protein